MTNGVSIAGEAEMAGGLAQGTETTARVLAERRLQALSALATGTASVTDSGALIRSVVEVLRAAVDDVPFAALARLDPATGEAELTAAVHLGPEAWRAIEPAARAAGGGGRVSLPEAPGLASGAEAFVVALGASTFIVFGLNARLPFDDAYREHLTRIAQHVAVTEARIEAHHRLTVSARVRDDQLMQVSIATVVLIGPEHVFELASPLYEQMVGRQNLVGKPYFEALPEMAGTAVRGVLDHVYATGERFVTEEYATTYALPGDAQPEEHVFKFSLDALRDARGRVYGMMGVAVDITEQVRARRTIARAHREREKLLADLEVAARVKDEFLAMLGHELRNPLSPILTALELMKLRGDASTAKEQAILSRQVGHLVRLVDDLLDVSKIVRGKVDLRQQTVEIAEIANRALEMAGVLIEQRRHHLTVAVPAAGLRCTGNPVRLTQVLANLLTNAARYTEPGGHIHLAAARAGDEIVLSVTDDGIGIAPEVLPRIFDMFFQNGRGQDRAEGGLGLGLTLVQSLVALHGGSVSAKSEGLGKGSQLVVRLPAAPDDAPPSTTRAPRSQTAPSRGVSRRVLIVDDNVDAADLLAELLTEAGHVVTVAYDPVDALAAATRFAPEVMLIDIGLPVMSGYELAERLRALPATAHCRLVALTGYGQEQDHARSAEVGFEMHLVKPIDLERLVAVVRSPGGEPAARGGMR